MRLLVKGNASEAVKAAQEHGFHTVSVFREHPDYSETSLTVGKSETNGTRAGRWLMESPIEAPFPSGSLLYFTFGS